MPCPAMALKLSVTDADRISSVSFCLYIPDSRSYVSNGEERVLWLAKIFPSIQKVLEKGRAAAS